MLVLFVHISKHRDYRFLSLTLCFLGVALYIILFFKGGQDTPNEIKIPERSEFIWLYKRRRGVIFTYLAICFLFVSMLFIGHKVPKNSFIVPELNQETNRSESKNLSQPIYTLETKYKTRK